MKRELVAAMAGTLLLGIVLGAAPAALAAGDAATYSWVIDAPPPGPNVIRSAGGEVIVVVGQGTFTIENGTGTIAGGGSFALLDPEGNEVTTGDWTVDRLLRYEEQGPLFPAPLDHYVKGLLRAGVSFDGLGFGRMTLFCHSGPSEVEGVTFRFKAFTFNEIVNGSTTLERV